MNLSDNTYKRWLESIKQKIKATQLKVAVSVSTQMLEMYWQLAEEIVAKQRTANWGEAVLEQLSIDLRLSFPNISGFSRRNLYAIRQWYLFYNTAYQFVPQPVAQIPWGHNRLIISKIKNIEEAIFYCKVTLENGWNRDNLALAIENKYFETKGKSITNFKKTLPPVQSELAEETLKNPYNFDF
jgi:predicted nuclease of restriction endonuclease-like (RecB) superfamily